MSEAINDSEKARMALKTALSEFRLSGDSLVENCRLALSEQTVDWSIFQTEEFLRDEIGFVFEDIFAQTPKPEALRTMPLEAIRSFGVMPLDCGEDFVKVAMADPTDTELLANLRLLTGRNIKPVAAGRGDIDKLIEQHFRNGAGKKSEGSAHNGGNGRMANEPKRLGEAERDNPIIRMVHEVIGDAIRMGSSDIHFEPFEREMQVRLRQDGVLRVHRNIQPKSKAEVISRIKVMAHLDIAERRRPQDGRIRVEGSSGPVDLRVSTLPTEYGEKVVLRILDKASVPLDLSVLGLDATGLSHLEAALRQPYGMILMTGPTGAGKTTTLYACLNRIKSPEVNIVTVEDPIEYKLDGVIQTAVKTEVGYTFANALRTILRQDPNVILVGEIRDQETAEIAVRSSLTGHLVLSTLHANDAPGAVARLLDMGIEPFLLASSVTFIGAQRLVRRVCSHCAESVTPQGLPPEFDVAGSSFRKGKGCSFCGRTGYSGRVGIYEAMPISDALRRGITERIDASRLRETAVAEGMVSLRQDGLRKATAGTTTVEEVYRETA